MATLDDFTRYVAIDVPNCPLPVIENAVLRAAQMFYERTERKRETIEFPTVDVLASNLAGYALTVPAQYLLSRVASVRTERFPRGLGITSEYEAAGMMTPGMPSHYYVKGNGNLVLVRPPETAGDIVTVDVVLKPAMSATVLDDFLLNDNRDLIVYGAKAILMALHGRPWSNVEMAAAYSNIFNDGTVRDYVSGLVGRSGGSLQVKPRKF